MVCALLAIATTERTAWDWTIAIALDLLTLAWVITLVRCVV
jgi:hypothetical protein